MTDALAVEAARVAVSAEQFLPPLSLAVPPVKVGQSWTTMAAAAAAAAAAGSAAAAAPLMAAAAAMAAAFVLS